MRDEGAALGGTTQRPAAHPEVAREPIDVSHVSNITRPCVQCGIESVALRNPKDGPGLDARLVTPGRV
jgi:hypothetical protein